MTTTVPSPAGEATPPALGPMQRRLNDNIVTLVGYRQTTKAALARAIGFDPAGITARLKGETEWRTGDIEKAARHLHVRWEWLLLPLPELLAKCTAGDLNPEPADSLHTVVSMLARSVPRPSAATSSSPRSRGPRMALVRPMWGEGASTPRRVAV